MLNDKSILVTGGTGSFGRAFVKTLLERYPRVRRLVIFSRDELKQFEMAQQFPPSQYPCLRFFIGDVRDAARLKRAMEGIDLVFHCAALKHVGSGEYNPFEATQTNIVGTQNVIDACLARGVTKLIYTSTPSVVHGGDAVDGVDESAPYRDVFVELLDGIIATDGAKLKPWTLTFSLGAQ